MTKRPFTLEAVYTDIYNRFRNLDTRITNFETWEPTDELSKVSSNDTTAGYLNGKLVAGDGISLTENNDGGNETLTVDGATYACLLTNSANISIPNATFTVVSSYDTEIFDETGMHSGSNSFMVINTPGIYFVFTQLRWATNTTGERSLLIDVNASLYLGDTRPATSLTLRQPAVAFARLSDGDTLRLRVYQNSGGALDLVTATNGIIFGAIRMGE